MPGCQDLVKHQGAGPAPPGRGQEETDKCAARGVSPVSGRGARPRVPARLRGAAELAALGPALQPGSPALAAPGAPPPRSPDRDPLLPVCIPAAQLTPPPPRSPAAWLRRPPGPESGSKAAPAEEASRPAARAAPGSPPASRPRGICDSPHYLRPGARADSCTHHPAGQFNTLPEQLLPDRSHLSERVSFAPHHGQLDFVPPWEVSGNPHPLSRVTNCLCPDPSRNERLPVTWKTFQWIS